MSVIEIYVIFIRDVNVGKMTDSFCKDVVVWNISIFLLFAFILFLKSIFKRELFSG